MIGRYTIINIGMTLPTDGHAVFFFVQDIFWYSADAWLPVAGLGFDCVSVVTVNYVAIFVAQSKVFEHILLSNNFQLVYQASSWGLNDSQPLAIIILFFTV